jgi:D-alanine-D-alanine ligase
MVAPSSPRPLSKKSRTLGPVADLERHLPAEWWRTLFNATYVKTDGDVVENAANTTADVDLLLAATGLKPSARVLDLCCGQGRHSLELASRGFNHLTGLDRSHYLIQLARRRARAARLTVNFLEGDARSLPASDTPFDGVAILGNSFGYFDCQAEDLAVLAAVRAALRPGGILAMDISDGDWVRGNFEPRSWEWIDRHHFVCRERMLSADGTRLVCREVVTHTERGVLVDQFYAERLYAREQLHTLLLASGFVRPCDHGSILSGSDRNQDLGMMSHRIFVTAHAPGKRPTRSARTLARRPDISDVAVILGDPRLADAVKLDGKFQPEDLTAVQHLKTALAELPGYRFRFLDNHATLAADLRAHPPAFALNLCDEGFVNEPLHELHIPALLEMLSVPCSGSGPASLAICFDKSVVNAAAATMGIPVPLELYVGPGDIELPAPASFPVIVKPACGDGSVGITAESIAQNRTELVATLARLRAELPGRALLVQELLTGPEYTVGLIGNPAQGFQLLPVIEADYSRLPATLPHILAYDSKFRLDSPYWTDIRYVSARLDQHRLGLLHDYSKRLFERLGCRDFARIDFRAAADGTLKLLEVNPNPSWRWDDDPAIMAGLAGWSYAELLGRLIAAAQARVHTAAVPAKLAAP